MPKDIVAEPVVVTPQAISDWLDAGEIVLVDVRETKEYDREHIAGALLLPLSELDVDVFPVLADKPLVLHCAIGKRSEAAAKMLLKAGYNRVLHMEGGLTAWKEAGLPIEEAIVEPAPTPAAKAEPVFLCPTPGAVLAEEFLEPAGLSPVELAGKVGVAVGTIERLLNGERVVDAELSLRLARYFSTAKDFWILLQVDYDIERTRAALGEDIRASIRPRAV